MALWHCDQHKESLAVTHCHDNGRQQASVSQFKFLPFAILAHVSCQPVLITDFPMRSGFQFPTDQAAKKWFILTLTLNLTIKESIKKTAYYNFNVNGVRWKHWYCTHCSTGTGTVFSKCEVSHTVTHNIMSQLVWSASSYIADQYLSPTLWCWMLNRCIAKSWHMFENLKS